LRRAFASLDTQRVLLGTCSITVGTTRQSANAECAGSATWTPKVGGGVRTERRRWMFELRAAGGQWQIVRATAR
jgi:hypothetical protein